MGHRKPTEIVTTATPWLDLVVVCSKCSKKLDGGFGPDGEDSLARALKRELRSSGRRRSVRVIESKCLGLCPKGAVTLVPGGRPGSMLAIPRGMDPAAILAGVVLKA